MRNKIQRDTCLKAIKELQVGVDGHLGKKQNKTHFDIFVYSSCSVRGKSVSGDFDEKEE